MPRSLGHLRFPTLLLAVVGALGSAGLTWRAGMGSASILLRVLFVFWVMAPFAALLLAWLRWDQWPLFVRAMLFGATVFLTFLSLALYSRFIPAPPGKPPAFVYVATPLALWGLIVMDVLVAVMLRRRQSNG